MGDGGWWVVDGSAPWRVDMGGRGMAKTATIDLQIKGTETYTGPNQAGTDAIAKIIRLTYPNATLLYSSRATFKAAAADAAFDLGAASASTSTAAAGTPQVETLTAVGAITATGNITVTVTAAGLAGSPLAVPVAVVNGDAAATWAGKVRTTLAATAAVTALYDVGGTGTAVTLTRKIEAANDATLLMAATAGTATNASLPINSANTTAGVAAAGTVLSGTVDGEVRGEAVVPATEILMVLLVAEGCTVEIGGPVTTNLEPGTFNLASINAAAGALVADWASVPLAALSSGGAGTLDVIVFGRE